MYATVILRNAVSIQIWSVKQNARRADSRFSPYVEKIMLDHCVNERACLIHAILAQAFVFYGNNHLLFV